VSGWIKLHRSIFKHWIAESPEYFYGWAFIINEANYQDKKWVGPDGLINIPRGSFARSQTKLAQQLGWSRRKLSKFLELLEEDGMIAREAHRKYTIVSIVNYREYQDGQNSDAPIKHQSRTDRAPIAHRSRTQLKNDQELNKKGKKGESEARPPAPARVTEEFDFGTLSDAEREWIHQSVELSNFDTSDPRAMESKRPLKKYPHVWLRPTEWVELIHQYENAGLLPQDLNAQLKRCQSILADTDDFQRRRKRVFHWLSGYLFNDALDGARKRRYLAESGA
jgi:biotin operon repressor